jgi:flagellar hook-associated protein 1 FlgK
MSLTQALNTALAGLNATQASLSITSGNIANANTPGYVAETGDQVEVASAGNFGSSVDIAGINRNLSSLLQSELWTETSGGAFADARAQLYQQLQQVYGTPGPSGAFDTAYNNFTASLQALSTSPASYSAQSGALGAAKQLTQRLNSMTGSVQALRNQAEGGIASDVEQANQALQQIAEINRRLTESSTPDATAATLADQRDQDILQLSQFMNVNVIKNPNNQLSVFTSTGLQLVGGAQASKLEFDNRGSLSATAAWSVDPAKDGVGTITLVAPDQTRMDLVANKSIQSGQIAAYLEMRDQVLPQAQSQLDALAAQMSQSLSDQSTNGTPVTSGSQAGFSIDVGALLPGNPVQVTYTDAANAQHKVTIVRVDDPSALPLPDSATTDPNDHAVGVDFSGGMGSVVAQLNAALGANLQFSNPSGTVLQVLNSPFGPTVVNSVAATATATALAAGSTQLPFFTDGTAPITGAITAAGSQDTGLAGRITVNNALLASPGALVAYQTSPATAAGDPTRPNFLLNQLTQAVFAFSPRTRIGTVSAPFSGTLPEFMNQIASEQSQAANAASNLQQGQDVVVNALQQRFNSQSGVNIDTELTNLITLQHAYAANARVMSTVQAMLTILSQIGA